MNNVTQTNDTQAKLAPTVIDGGSHWQIVNRQGYRFTIEKHSGKNDPIEILSKVLRGDYDV